MYLLEVFLGVRSTKNTWNDVQMGPVCPNKILVEETLIYCFEETKK